MLPILFHCYFINKYSNDLEYGIKKAKIIKFFDVGLWQPGDNYIYDYQKLLLMTFPDGCKYEFHSDLRKVRNSKFKIGDSLYIFYIRRTDVNCDLEQNFVFSTTVHYQNPRFWVLLIIVFLWMTIVIETMYALLKMRISKTTQAE